MVFALSTQAELTSHVTCHHISMMSVDKSATANKSSQTKNELFCVCILTWSTHTMSITVFYRLVDIIYAAIIQGQYPVANSYAIC